MSYSSPATYSTEGNTGYKAVFGMGSPPVSVLEIKSINNKPVSAPEVDFTHLLSPAATREIKPGLNKPGTIKIGGNFIGDATQQNFLQQAQGVGGSGYQGPNTFWFQISAPIQQGTKTYTGNGYGYIADYGNGPLEVDKPWEFEVTIQLEGQYFETIA